MGESIEGAVARAEGRGWAIRQGGTGLWWGGPDDPALWVRWGDGREVVWLDQDAAMDDAGAVLGWRGGWSVREVTIDWDPEPLWYEVLVALFVVAVLALFGLALWLLP